MNRSARRHHPRLSAGVLMWLVLTVVFVGVAYGAPARPLIFVPGILGSQLADKNGHVIWGEIDSLRNFKKLDTIEGDTLAPDGLIKRINVLGPFWTIHEYDTLLTQLHELGYVEGETLFIFAYDWRQSIIDDTAQELDRFVTSLVRSHPALSGEKFDLLAHSMGGIVAKVWALKGGAAKLHKIIYMATPFRGSMNSFATLSEGWGWFNVMAGGIETIRRVALSFPSLYELLPTYEHCCRLGTPQRYTDLDILKASTWRDRNWLPPEYAASGARAHVFDLGLDRARQIGTLMRTAIPDVPELRFAGDVIATPLWLYVNPAGKDWHSWSFRRERGDGTVPVWSANNNFKTTEGSDPSFAEHATIFEDKWLANKLASELVGGPPPPVAAELVEEITTNDGVKRLALLRSKLDPPLVLPGATTKLNVTLDFADDVMPGIVEPSASVRDEHTVKLKMIETTTQTSAMARRLTFVREIRAPREEGTYRIDINVPSKGPVATYLSVYKVNDGDRQ